MINSRYGTGLLFMFCSAVAFSTIGVFSMGITLPIAEIIFIRGVFGALSIAIVAYFLTNGRLTDRSSYSWPAMSVAALLPSV
jgi:hypothetical protein